MNQNNLNHFTLEHVNGWQSTENNLKQGNLHTNHINVNLHKSSLCTIQSDCIVYKDGFIYRSVVFWIQSLR